MITPGSPRVFFQLLQAAGLTGILRIVENSSIYPSTVAGSLAFYQANSNYSPTTGSMISKVSDTGQILWSLAFGSNPGDFIAEQVIPVETSDYGEVLRVVGGAWYSHIKRSFYVNGSTGAIIAGTVKTLTGPHPLSDYFEVLHEETAGGTLDSITFTCSFVTIGASLYYAAGLGGADIYSVAVDQITNTTTTLSPQYVMNITGHSGRPTWYGRRYFKRFTGNDYCIAWDDNNSLDNVLVLGGTTAQTSYRVVGSSVSPAFQFGTGTLSEYLSIDQDTSYSVELSGTNLVLGSTSLTPTFVPYMRVLGKRGNDILLRFKGPNSNYVPFITTAPATPGTITQGVGMSPWPGSFTGDSGGWNGYLGEHSGYHVYTLQGPGVCSNNYSGNFAYFTGVLYLDGNLEDLVGVTSSYYNFTSVTPTPISLTTPASYTLKAYSVPDQLGGPSIIFHDTEPGYEVSLAAGTVSTITSPTLASIHETIEDSEDSEANITLMASPVYTYSGYTKSFGLNSATSNTRRWHASYPVKVGYNGASERWTYFLTDPTSGYTSTHKVPVFIFREKYVVTGGTEGSSDEVGEYRGVGYKYIGDLTSCPGNINRFMVVDNVIAVTASSSPYLKLYYVTPDYYSEAITINSGSTFETAPTSSRTHMAFIGYGGESGPGELLTSTSTSPYLEAKFIPSVVGEIPDVSYTLHSSSLSSSIRDMANIPGDTEHPLIPGKPTYFLPGGYYRAVIGVSSSPHLYVWSRWTSTSYDVTAVTPAPASNVQCVAASQKATDLTPNYTFIAAGSSSSDYLSVYRFDNSVYPAVFTEITLSAQPTAAVYALAFDEGATKLYCLTGESTHSIVVYERTPGTSTFTKLTNPFNNPSIGVPSTQRLKCIHGTCTGN